MCEFGGQASIQLGSDFQRKKNPSKSFQRVKLSRKIQVKYLSVW
jgi:hypothetical protein